MRIKIFLLALMLSAISARSYGIDFSRVSIAWQYDPASKIKIQHRTVQHDKQYTVFIQILADSLAIWKFELFKQQEYKSGDHKQFTGYKSDTLISNSDMLVMKLDFEKPVENLLVVEATIFDSNYYYDISINNGNLTYPSFYPIDENGMPILEKYVNKGTVNWKGNSSFFVRRYNEKFPPSDPPMAQMKPLAPSISVDSTFLFQNKAKLEDGFFYVISKDSNDVEGVKLLKTTPYYPELKKLDELVASFYYILTDAEKKRIESSSNIKQSFDSFWLNTYKNKFRARNAIRNYYNWVEESNQLFTDFKQGWKTDRGMIYIVFGPPDEVYRTANGEEWFYDNGPAFEYTIISTFFSNKTYALRRKVEFEKVWFEALAAIRSGNNE